MVKIAKSYIDQGGEAVFFSHGGIFEHIAEDIGCDVIHLRDWWTENPKKGEKIWNKGVKDETLFLTQFEKKYITKSVEEEIQAFKKTGVKAVVNTWNLTCSISARALNLPLIAVVSGTVIPPFLRFGPVTFPENYENIMTRIVPSSLKNHLARWYLVHNKMLVRRFNAVSKIYHGPCFHYLNDIILGDYNLICDDINFLGIPPTKEFPLENYIGPIFHGPVLTKKQQETHNRIMNHLKRQGRSILVSMGSFPNKQVLITILDALNGTEYNVIVIHTKTIKKHELPKTKPNILLQEYVPSVKTILEHIDVAITHGGRGTIYSVVYSGKPAICIPLQYEQQFNINCLIRHGSAVKLSCKNFSQKKLFDALDKIFNQYQMFLKNAKTLATILPNKSSEERAAKRIIEIMS